MKKILAILFLLYSTASYAAVSGESLMNVEDTAAPSGVVQANRVKDAATMTADAITSGIIANGGLLFNGVNWDRMPGDKTNGAFVNIKSSITLTFAGSHTPSDAYANPTDAVNNFSLLGGFNGTTWDRITSGANNADAVAVRTLGVLQTGGYQFLFNGTNWDRARSVVPNTTGDGYNANTASMQVTNFMYLLNGSGLWDRAKSGVNTGQFLVDNTSASVTRITTNTTTTVKATAGYINQIIVNTANASAIVTLYNIASAGCTGTPASGFTAILPVAVAGQLPPMSHTFTLGICAVTSGGAATDISILYR